MALKAWLRDQGLELITHNLVLNLITARVFRSEEAVRQFRVRFPLSLFRHIADLAVVVPELGPLFCTVRLHQLHRLPLLFPQFVEFEIMLLLRILTLKLHIILVALGVPNKVLGGLDTNI